MPRQHAQGRVVNHGVQRCQKGIIGQKAGLALECCRRQQQSQVGVRGADQLGLRCQAQRLGAVQGDGELAGPVVGKGLLLPGLAIV